MATFCHGFGGGCDCCFLFMPPKRLAFNRMFYGVVIPSVLDEIDLFASIFLLRERISFKFLFYPFGGDKLFLFARL